MEATKGRRSPSEVPMEAMERVSVSGVRLRVVGGSLEDKMEVGRDLELCCESGSNLCSLRFSQSGEVVYKLEVHARGAVYSAHSNSLLFRVDGGSAVAIFADDTDAASIQEHIVKNFSMDCPTSVFDLRTEEASAKQYFQFYGYLSQQQNMMQDYTRTSTFQTAILHNLTDFKDKVVLDVGAGTGVLSFFALQGGARKVYAVEASNMAAHCAKLVKANKFCDRMKVIPGKIEEVIVPEEVDVIISEPMGYMLFNERMLETYLHAKKWLKPGGKMYPTQGILYVAPFSDEALYLEQMGKTYFWQQRSFHGVDVSVLHSEAMAEYFRQPIVDTFDIRILMARPIGHTTDFASAHEKELHKIDIPLQFKTWSTGYMHGLAFWFDVAFIGAQATVWLSTAPFQPLTHWYQVRLLLQQPLYVQEGQEITGIVKMAANERQSYDITVDLKVTESGLQSSGTYDLKNPNFRYMTTPQAPPGSLHTNPTESFFDTQSVPSVAPPISSAFLQTHPKTTRPSLVHQPGGYPHNQPMMGVLQTGTEVIPVVNGSIISPSVQQPSPSGGLQLGHSSADPAHPTPSLYYRPQQLHWGSSLHSVPYPAPHQHGMETGGIGIGDLGIGPSQHGLGTVQYGMGAVAQAHHVNIPPTGGNMYQQKWTSPQQTVLASRS